MSRAPSKSFPENWSAPAKGFLALVGLVGGLISLANAQTEESADIQAKREQRDATVWKAEVAAEAYGESIVKFWDSLREAESPLQVFRTFSLGSVEKPNWTLNQRHPQGVFEFIHLAPRSGIQLLKSYQLQTMVNDFEQQGYELDQFDFRHSGFELQGNGIAISEIEFEINVSGPSHTLYRRSFRGIARIQWDPEADEEGIHHPSSITFLELKQFRRTGKKGFVTRDWLDSGVSNSPYRYIMVEDVDLDGKPDIVFPQENMVYRNYGNFEFDPKPLLESPPALSVIDSALLVDLDLDGKREYVVCLRGIGVLVFEQHRKTGAYSRKPKIIWEPKTLYGAVSLTAGDINSDGLPDLFIGQNVESHTRGVLPKPYYDANDGLSSYLLMNRGRLKFREMSKETGLAERSNRRNRVASIADINGDGLQDLLMSSNFSGVDVYSSSESDLLAGVADDWLESPQMFGSTQLIADFDRDGALDIFVGGAASEVGRRMSAMGSHREGFEESEAIRPVVARGSRLWRGGENGFSLFEDGGVFERAGWVWSGIDIDFNNDGYLDLYLNNGNISRATAKNYDEIFWRHDLYDIEGEEIQDMLRFFGENDPGKMFSEDEYSWAPYQKNRLLANFGESGFVDIAYLMGVSLEVDGRAGVSEDFNIDGKPDLIVLESDLVEEKIQVRILENDLVGVGNWVGVQLQPAPDHSVIGATTRVFGEDYESARVNARGQIRNSQTSSFMRFGIGELDSIDRIEITWSDGQATVLSNPAINQYHAVKAGQK